MKGIHVSGRKLYGRGKTVDTKRRSDGNNDVVLTSCSSKVTRHLLPSRLKGRLQSASDPYLIFHNKSQDTGRIIANDSQTRIAPESTKKDQLQETVLDAARLLA